MHEHTACAAPLGVKDAFNFRSSDGSLIQRELHAILTTGTVSSPYT